MADGGFLLACCGEDPMGEHLPALMNADTLGYPSRLGQTKICLSPRYQGELLVMSPTLTLAGVSLLEKADES